METLKAYLRFDKMIAPLLLKILFWPALAATIFYSAWLILEGNMIGFVPLIVGSMFVRVIFEGMILFFTINQKLEVINQKLESEKE